MKKYLPILLIAFLSGCSVLQSKEATVACQAADAATTVIALNAGMTEANPIMAGVINSLGIPGFLLVKAAVTVFLLSLQDEIPETMGVINGATCAIASRNLLLL